MCCKNTNEGFSLVEIIITIAVFTLFAVGIYSGIQFVFKVVYNSRIRIIETAILNEQIEIIRNIPFSDVGIINGSPAGVLERTVTTTRNGIDFTITRTIRNIDDPFDGTIGGTPNDTSPADYKLAHLEIICSACGQNQTLDMVTRVGPKYLEGDPNNGALFIEVFDAAALPVQGADVHVVATTTSSTIDLIDTTDNDGMLRLVDLSQGIGAYHITVSKSGYTTDQTIAPDETIQNPVKPPASVVAQDVTSISFSIDRVSSIDLRTINAFCQPIGSVPVNLLGTKLLGTDPEIYAVNRNIVTGMQGEHTFGDLVWDSYGLRPSNYDLIGSIPALPVTIGPNVDQSIRLILGADTAYSLLVNVADSITGLPVSNAIVTVTSTGYLESEETGIGFLRQTDWSGGSGQLEMGDEIRYWSDDGGVEIANPAGDLKLRMVGQTYVSSAELESSIFDLGTGIDPINIVWEPVSQPPLAGAGSLKFQLASSSTSTPPSGWNYLGPDGTSGTYYDENNPEINSIHSGGRYFRYKVFLSTNHATTTPTLSDFSISYTTGCTPPGQAYFGGLSNQVYSVEVAKAGYQSRTESITVDGDRLLTIDLVAE